jgi:hypothetical protein
MNTNPETGISYGYVAANDLDSDVVDELMYGRQVIDRNYDDWCKEHDSDDYEQPDEPILEGALEGVVYRTSWLGGALHFFIFLSPHIVQGGVASMCVPNACILNKEGVGDATGYGVPSDWWA